MSLVGRLAVLLSIMVLTGTSAFCADEVEAQRDAGSAAPRFRRIFLPADQIGKGTWQEGYLPIEADEFEKLVEAVHNHAIGAPGVRASLIERGTHKAELVGEDVLVGESVWEISQPADVPTLLALTPCNLAIGSATWQAPNSKPAILGSGPDGRVKVLAEGTKLQCNWSLRGERTASGSVAFRMELPGAPIAHMSIDLPAGLELIADHGVVSKSASPNAGKVHWTLELGGNPRIYLRLLPEETARERRPLTLLRQTLTYEFTARGVNLGAQLNVDIHGEPLQRIAVDLDSPLRLVAARYGELEIPWSATADVETGMSHVVLELPEPIVGTGRVLQLRAIAPLTSGKPWRLPGLQPEAVSWQEGTAVLLIPNSLVLERLSTEGCRQSRLTTLPAPAAGESLEVQYYRPGASIEVVLGRPRDRMKVESGTLVEVGADQINSRSALSLTATRGERLMAQAEISPPWTVDAVEALGPNRVLDWELDEQPARPGLLKMHLDRAITASTPVRLLVRGHRSLPAGPAFEARELEMIPPGQFDSGTRLISVQGADGYELRWAASEDLKRKDPLELTQGESQLFPQPPAGLLFSEDSSFAAASLTLERRKVSFAADVRIDAAVQVGALTETYTIQCSPETARVERLLVHFSHPRTETLEWKLAGANSGQLASRRLSPDEIAEASLPASGEVWELALQLARSGPFELRAVRSVPFDKETALSLAAVAEAATERGTVTIRALGDTGLSITNRRLTSVPAELLDADRYQTARATYQYQPSRDLVGSEAAVSIAPAPRIPAESGAWAWNGRLDSRYAVDGTCVHLATFRLQTAGQQQLRLTLPADATLQDAWIDAQRIPLVLTTPQQGGLLIDLPAGRAFCLLSLYYHTPAQLPRLASSVTVPFPQLDVPVITRYWSVSLPPGYELKNTEGSLSIESQEPLNWRQRLFGVLGRGMYERVFNPLSADDWQQLGPATRSEAALRISREFLESVGGFVTERSGGEDDQESKWGDLLAATSDAAAQSRRVVLVDHESLAAVLIKPETRIRIPAAGTPLQRVVGLLKQANVVLIIEPSTILVTTAAAAASFSDQLAELEAPITYTLHAGPLDNELHRGLHGGLSSHFEPVDVWRSRPEQGKAPWTAWRGPNPNRDEMHSWQVYSLALPDSAHPDVAMLHSAAMQSLGWALFLAVVAVGLATAQRRPLAMPLLAPLAGVVALTLPAVYSPLASSILMAALVCLALRVMRLPNRSNPGELAREPAPRPRSSVLHRIATGVLAAVVIHAGVTLFGSQPSGESATTPRSNVPPPSAPVAQQEASASGERVVPPPARLAGEVYRVYVPVDDQDRPLGDKYYLPEEFYSALKRMAASASGKPRDWLLTRVLYQGTLSRDPVHKQLGLSQLKASLDLHVFHSNQSVRLPFPREGTANPVVGARLEGRPVSVTWNAAGDELAIVIPRAGQYRLELDLEPILQSDSTTAGFDMAIPALCGATLELNLPRDAPQIELPAARGQVRIDKQRGELRAQLGNSNRLAVRWPFGIGMEAAAPNLEVEELVWVKVRPGTTVLDARFRYRVISGRVRQIRLLTDPRLRLLPSIDAKSPIAEVHTIPGDPQKIDLELSRSVSDQVTVELSFLLTGTSGVGNLRLPRIESAGARATKRWMAVSVDPALQYKEQAGEDSKPLQIADFSSAWGDADLQPQAAYSIPRGEAMWVLATQPNEPHTTVEETLSVSVDRAVSLVHLNALLTNSPRDYLFQLKLAGPPDLAIERLSLMEDDAERVARWSTDGSGGITVFLTAPVTGKQQLTLRGRIPTANGEGLAIPRLQIINADVTKSQLQVFRQSGALVEVPGVPGLKEIEPNGSPAPEGFGARVGSYLMEDAQAQVKLKVEPNSPKSKAVMLTSLVRDSDRWMADVDYHVEVSDGLVDTLQFEIPPQWSEPYRLEPQMPYKLVPIPGDARRQMIVQPAEPIQGKFQVKVRGRVALSAGDRLRVPDISPLRGGQLERFVVLPQHLDLQQVTWETLGLARAALPAGLFAPGSSTPQAIYQVTAEHFQASLKAVERSTASAQVVLADIHLAWQHQGALQGVATFDLKPAGATSCILEMPGEYRLVHASVDTVPALLVSMDENHWRMGLGPPQLPQRIEVVFTGPAPGARGPLHFHAPRLVGLDVERTLWTVHGPVSSGTGQASASDQNANAAEQQLARLTSIASIVPLLAEVRGEHLPEEIARWYRPWKARYTQSRALLEWELIAARQTNMRSEEESEARKLDQIISSVDAQFGLTTPPSRGAIAAYEPSDLMLSHPAGLLPAHYSTRGQSHDLTLEFPAEISEGRAGRISLALMLVAVAVGIVVYLRTHALPKFPPAVVLALVGALWWWALLPSLAGLAILFIACWAALRPRSGQPTAAMR